MGLINVILFACCLLHVEGSEVNNHAMTMLRKKTLLDYDSNSRPIINQNYKTVVYLGISAVNLDVNDHEQTMIFASHVELMWTDEFLQWKPEEFNNITTLHFGPNEIWSPDIALRNSAKSMSVVPTTTLPMVSNYDGNVSWMIPFTAEVPCQLNLTFWPIDRHTCTMQFASWTHHDELINLRVKKHLGSNGMSFERYKINNQWKILSNFSSSVDITVDTKLYNVIEFNVTVQRQAAAHATYVTQTTLALMLIVLVSYFLPLRYHLSRLLLHLMALSLLVICNFLLFISLPSSGGGIPFVVRYFSGSIILTTISLICNVALTTSLCSEAGKNSQSVVKKKFVTFLGLSNASCNGRTQVVSSNEIAYSNLDEELRDMSDNRFVESNNIEENQSIQPSIPPVTSDVAAGDQPSELGFFRLVNMVLFCMFAIAYVVDYIILRSSISQ